MSDRDIYQILEILDAAQKSVKQLPALFRPAQTSPQLSGKYPGKNATQGYMVGEDRYDHENPMARAVHIRIINQHPEWIIKYGVEELMQAIEDVVGEEDWEEIGSSDVSAYVRMIGDTLRDRKGSREEMDRRRPFAEERDEEELNRDGEPDHGSFGDDEEDEIDDDGQTMADRARRDGRGGDEDKEQGVSEDLRDPKDNPCWKGYHPVGTKKKAGKTVPNCVPKEGIAEAQATEDVLSTMKKKLGDYLQDVATAIKKDPDLMSKIPQDIDSVKAVKTIRTDDGHEIKIHGNEDDGFRISIKDRPSKTVFKDLDEATMACEMFCAHRRNRALSADYIEEKHIS